MRYIIPVIILFLFVSGCTNYPADPVKSSDVAQFSTDEKFIQLRKSHDYYTKATKEERIMRWVTLFSNSKYKRDGQSKLGEYDCISAVMTYLWSWGANAVMEDIPSLNLRALKLNSIKQMKIRFSSDVASGDIIVLKPVLTSWHCGIVYVVKHKRIIYMDMNPRTGMGFAELDVDSPTIYQIYQPSFSYWLGDLLTI